MTPVSQRGKAEFDECAARYDEDLLKGLSITGEGKDYYAAGRVHRLKKCLQELGVQPREILDFGCGVGDSAPYLLGLGKDCRVTGLEVSDESLRIAQLKHDPARTRFLNVAHYTPAATMDVAYCNGVFHHIPPAQRKDSASMVARSLRPGGILSFWENNPWNPGTRYVMSKIPFDRDAIALSCLEARNLLKEAGFEILQTDFLFFFLDPCVSLDRWRNSSCASRWGDSTRCCAASPYDLMTAVSPVRADSVKLFAAPLDLLISRAKYFATTWKNRHLRK